MFTPDDRERIRASLIEAGRADPRITGGAITGSASTGNEDRWSDIDLAFGVRDASRIPDVLDDWTARMYRDHDCAHHIDVVAGAWVYRVFLLRSTLQVDIAFAPASEFGARAASFRLVFGGAADLREPRPPKSEELVGWAWLYALHVRSSIKRGRLWQAEYMVSAMRDQVLSLACVRLGLPPRDGRGLDRLPKDVTGPLEAALVGRLSADDLSRSFRHVTHALLLEIEHVAPELAQRLRPVLIELAN